MLHQILPSIRRALGRAALALTLAAAVAGPAGCSTNPATGESTFTLQSWDWERSMALTAGPQFTEEFGGPVPDEVATQYVSEVGNRLKDVALEEAHAEVPDLPWEFTFLDSKVINAFALPGGQVYMTRGLASRLENEAEMAGVLGHEIGHVLARHGNQRISKQIPFNVGIALASIAVGTADEDSQFRQIGQYAVPAVAIGGNVVLLKYGRGEELEADWLGMQYMTGAGYDPAGQLGVMEMLQREAGQAQTPEILSTHPYPESRIEQIKEELKTKYQSITGNPDYVLLPERYQERMLSRLEQLPPPQHQPEQPVAGSALGPPELWCAQCRQMAHARD